MASRAVDTNVVFRFTLVFPVFVAFGGAVEQCLVFRTNHTAIILIISTHVSPLWVVITCRLWKVHAHAFANIGNLAGGIRNNGFHFRESLCRMTIDYIKYHAVMRISRHHRGLRYIKLFILYDLNNIPIHFLSFQHLIYHPYHLLDTSKKRSA